MDDEQEIASRRVEHAMRRFEESWRNRWDDPRAVEQDIDELDVAVGLWLDAQETAAERREATSRFG